MNSTATTAESIVGSIRIVGVQLFMDINALQAGFDFDEEMNKAALPEKMLRRTVKEECVHHLRNHPVRFPEINRDHILENLPISTLGVSHLSKLNPSQLTLINKYLLAHSFRRVQLASNTPNKAVLGNGTRVDIPWRLGFHDFSPGGQMLSYMSGEEILGVKKLQGCVLDKVEWMLWQSLK